LNWQTTPPDTLAAILGRVHNFRSQSKIHRESTPGVWTLHRVNYQTVVWFSSSSSARTDITKMESRRQHKEYQNSPATPAKSPAMLSALNVYSTFGMITKPISNLTQPNEGVFRDNSRRLARLHRPRKKSVNIGACTVCECGGE
jgi:hypothetical protein